MKNKKSRFLIPGLLLAASLGALVACAPGGSSNGGASSNSIIDLRSATTQKLKIGEEMTIVYLLKDSKKEVAFRSDDENIATVDDFGSVRGISEGETNIVIYVLGNESDSISIHFTISKSFFITEKGYYNGQVDYSKEDEGLVKAKEGQVQMLVNAPGQEWYFKAHITRTGSANNDTGGRWGVGSFLVDKDHPIGNNMFWYGFRRPGGGKDQDVTPYYGGWRYAKNIVNNETDIDSSFIYDATKGVDVEIIRKGKMHYFTWSTEIEGHEKVKMAYAVPFFNDLDTYPGIYSQNQVLEVTKFEANSDSSYVDQKLNDFQKAESLDINCIDNRLINGNTYHLSTTVYPESTPNKAVSYKLYEEKEGISLSEDGTLTIDEGVTGVFRVIATSKNNKKITQNKKFEAINRPESGTGTINTGMVKTEDKDATIENNTIKVNSSKNYFPLNTEDSSWAVTLKVKNLSSALTEGQIGLLSSKLGYMDYFQNAFKYDGDTSERNIVSHRLGDEESNKLVYAKESSPVLNTENELTVIKHDNKQYVAVDGRLLGVYDALSDKSTPIIYTDNVKAEIQIASVKVGATDTKALLDQYKFFSGGNVNKNGETYTLARMDFAGNDMNWPPVNGFSNGIKAKEELRGDFDISFKLSNLDPMEANGKLDSKVLVYLDSGSPTCSMQLVIKGTKEKPTFALCPNYDDATWKEYSLDSSNIDFSKEVSVKIEKREEGCKVYFNNVAVLENSVALKNDNYDWTKTSPMLPGIGTFRCGATITDPTIKLVN